MKKTNDGGNSWAGVSIPNVIIHDVKFISGNVGYICGDSGYMANIWTSVFKTVNGGVTWNRIFFLADKTITGIRIVDLQTLYIKAINWTPSDSVLLYKSSDAGTNWITNRSDPISIGNQALEFISMDTGYYTVDYKLFSTFDAGATWQQSYDGASNTDSFYNIYFPSRDTGYAIGFDFILQTTNAGQNWTRRNIPSVQGLDLFFMNGLTGFICGADVSGSGWIQRTNDGGVNWILDYQSSVVFNNFDFPSDSIGYAAGQNGIILKYTAGPASISEINSAVNFSILPNPAKGDIVLKNIPSNAKIRIMDANGKTIFTGVASSDEMRIDVSAFAPGIYFVEVSDGKNISRKKFVKE